MLAELERLRTSGVTPYEVEKARHQLRARLVFENDSITNIAHQLGYFETIAGWNLVPSIASRLDAVTFDQVNAVAAGRLATDNRTIGWFDPLPIAAS